MQQQEVIAEQSALLQQMQGQITALSEQVKSLQEQISKDSHNSHLPPSSDRFVRQPKSLRKKSEKKSGGNQDTRDRACRFRPRQIRSSSNTSNTAKFASMTCAALQHVEESTD